MKSVRSTALRLLRRAFFQLRQPENFQPARRDFLKKTAAAGAVVALRPPDFTKIFTEKTPRVAIVGAGLGGMTAAWFLQKNGLRATVFEASHRVGGRTFSVRDTFGQGSAVDIGGEFADTWHTDLLGLAAELGIETYDLRQTTAWSGEDFVFYGGKRLTTQEIMNAMRPYCADIQRDIDRLPKNLSFQNIAPVRDLDSISIAAYLEKKGIGGWLADFLKNIFTSEYGMDATEQSALNMLTVLSLPAPDEEGGDLIGGEGSEVLKIRGGTMTVCEKLREKFTGDLHLHHPLTRLETTDSGAFKLSFDGGETAEAERVILAIPFTKLREIDLKIPLSEPKRRAIAELGYGNSTKLVFGFKSAPWLKKGFSGTLLTDRPAFPGGWDATAGQAIEKKEAAWTLFTGGKNTSELLAGDFKTNSKNALATLATCFPGAKKRHNGKTMLWPWESYAWSKAGYSSWKVGQWQAFAGAEGLPEGHVFFAGEHCSVEFQGFMNGAVQTGRLAAEGVLRSF